MHCTLFLFSYQSSVTLHIHNPIDFKHLSKQQNTSSNNLTIQGPLFQWCKWKRLHVQVGKLIWHFHLSMTSMSLVIMSLPSSYFLCAGLMTNLISSLQRSWLNINNLLLTLSLNELGIRLCLQLHTTLQYLGPDNWRISMNHLYTFSDITSSGSSVF